jgi:hypothetical protein
MTEREAVEILLIARRYSRRLGLDFKLDIERLNAAGLKLWQMERVECAANEIEMATQTILDRLDGEIGTMEKKDASGA